MKRFVCIVICVASIASSTYAQSQSVKVTNAAGTIAADVTAAGVTGTKALAVQFLTGGLPFHTICDSGCGSAATDVGATTGASETALTRGAVTAAIRILDTAQVAGSQLVTAKGDQTSGLWVNIKSAVALAVTGTFWPTLANAPGSQRLSDGTNFYDATKTGQLPAALVGGRLDVTVGAALPAGANVIGHVIADTGSTTAVTGNVTVVQATPANLQATVTGAVVGHGVAATAMRVELPTDGTGVVGLNAGSAIVGKVGIDQTTPGTTNLVAVSNTTFAQTATAVSPATDTGTCTNVTANTTIEAASASRHVLLIVSKLTNTDRVFIKLGATATSSFPPLEPGQGLSLDSTAFPYTGQVDAIANSGTQTICTYQW